MELSNSILSMLLNLQVLYAVSNLKCTKSRRNLTFILEVFSIKPCFLSKFGLAHTFYGNSSSVVMKRLSKLILESQ